MGFGQKIIPSAASFINTFGITVTNIVSNGNFASGTTGWSNYFSTKAAVNNILSVTGDGNGNSPYCYKNTGIAAANGKKVFVSLKYKVTNSSCQKVQIQVKGLTSGSVLVDILSPTQDTLYTFSRLFTMVNPVGNIEIRIVHYYADADTANGKVLQLSEVMAIDVTTLYGKGNELNEADCRAKFSTWFDGSQVFMENYRNINFNTLFAQKNIRTKYVPGKPIVSAPLVASSWAADTNCTLETNYADADQGYPRKSCVKIIAGGSGTTFKASTTLGSEANLLNKHLYVRYKVNYGTVGGSDEYIKLSEISVRICDYTGRTAYQEVPIWSYSGDYSHPGVCEISVPLTEGTAVNTPNLARSKYIEVYGVVATDTAPTIEILELRVEDVPLKAVIIWTFDNIYSAQKDACDYLKSKGMYANLFFCHTSVGGTGRLTQTQLDALYADGHVFCCYPWVLAKYWQNMTLAEKQYAIKDQRDWMITQGYTRGLKAFSTPGGSWREEDDLQIIGKYMETCAVVDNESGTIQCNGFSNLKKIARTVSDANPNGPFADKLTIAIDGKGLMNVFHHLDGSSDTTTLVDLESNIDSAAAAVTAGTLECLTIDQLLDRYLF